VRLKRPTRGHARATRCGARPLAPLFGLAPSGVYPAADVATGAVRSYRTISPLPPGASADARRRGRRCVFCGTFRGLTPPRRYLAPCPMEPGLSSPPAGGATVRPAPATNNTRSVSGQAPGTEHSGAQICMPRLAVRVLNRLGEGDATRIRRFTGSSMSGVAPKFQLDASLVQEVALGPGDPGRQRGRLAQRQLLGQDAQDSILLPAVGLGHPVGTCHQ
jgi:hypothetical protein